MKPKKEKKEKEKKEKIKKEKKKLSKKTKIIITLVIVIIMTIVAIAGYLFYKNNKLYIVKGKTIEIIIGDEDSISDINEFLNFEFKDITAEYIGEVPDVNILGEQVVKIRLTSIINQTTEIESILMVRREDINPEIVNIKDIVILQDEEIVIGEVSATNCYGYEIDVTNNSDGIDISKAGVQELVFTAVDETGNMTEEKSSLYVLPKSGKTIEKMLESGKYPSATDFIEQSDLYVDDFEISFDEENTQKLTLGKHTINIVFSKDEEKYIVEAKLNVRRTSDEIVLTGVKNLTYLTGKSISYKSGVSATDKYGTSLSVSVDTSNVKSSTAGTYDIVYSAKDSYGKSVSKTATITITELTQTYINSMLDSTLAKIGISGKSTSQKSLAIYNWIKSNVGYSSSGSHSSDLQLIYNALTGVPGDCYTYGAITYALYERAGISVVKMARVSGSRSNHRWVAVNLGSGWYHVDACPTSGGYNTYMFTDTKAKEYTADTDKRFNYNSNYYVYTNPGITIVE